MSTLDELQALEAAYHSGITTITHRGKTTVFASGDDLWRRILRLRAELGIGRPRAGLLKWARW